MKRYIKKGGNGGARADTGKLPHELMLEWAQSGLMQVPVRVAKGYYVKEFVVLSPSMRINLAKACANYYAPKLVAQMAPNKDEEPAYNRRDADLVIEQLMRPLRAEPAGKDKRGDDSELCQPQKPKRVA